MGRPSCYCTEAPRTAASGATSSTHCPTNSAWWHGICQAAVSRRIRPNTSSAHATTPIAWPPSSRPSDLRNRTCSGSPSAAGSLSSSTTGIRRSRGLLSCVGLRGLGRFAPSRGRRTAQTAHVAAFDGPPDQFAREFIPTLLTESAPAPGLPSTTSATCFRGLRYRLHARIPGSRLALMPGVGHMSDLEAPERFNAEVRGFLRSVQ